MTWLTKLENFYYKALPYHSNMIAILDVEDLSLDYQLDLIEWLARPDNLNDSLFFFKELPKASKKTLFMSLKKVLEIPIGVVPIFKQPMEITMKTLLLKTTASDRLGIQDFTFAAMLYKTIDFGMLADDSTKLIFPQIKENITPFKKLMLTISRQKFAEIEAINCRIFSNYKHQQQGLEML
jgi:hypothetical protein